MKSLAVFAGLVAVAESTQDEQKNRPVTKVTNLLKDMIKQLEKEADEDEEVYDKLACWCETYDKEKTKSIVDAEGKIKDLTVHIEELSAQSGRLNAEIKTLKAEVADSQDALGQAKAVRAKQLDIFNQQDKELSAAIEGLNVAIQSAGGFLQSGGSSFLQARTSLMNSVERVLQYADPDQRMTLNSWLQSRATERVSEGEQVVAAAGDDESVEVLKKIKELQEKHLAELNKQENHDVAQFKDLERAKQDQIQAAMDRIDEKKQELADTDQKLWNSKEDLTDTKASLTDDEKFIMMLKEKCGSTDAEWEERSKTRNLEIEACHKALAVLSSDEAHDIFSKTFNPDFMQVTAESRRKALRSKASKVLTQVAQRMQSPRLAALATQVKIDAFTRVKKAIEDMASQLTAEKQDEIRHKDYCIENFNTNQAQTEKKDSEKTTFIANIDDLNLGIKKLTQDISVLKNEIATMKANLKTADADRAAEEAEFQQTIADQRASQKILKSALEILKGFYEKPAALIQKDAQAPPPSFSDYKKNAAAGGVLSMIENIIADAKRMEDDATQAEQDAVLAHDTYSAETLKNIETKNKEIVNKSEEKAKAHTDLNQAIQDKENTMLELEQLNNENAGLHQDCDFVLANFELRQQARDEEIEALRQAKDILAGSKFSSFLQQ